MCEKKWLVLRSPISGVYSVNILFWRICCSAKLVTIAEKTPASSSYPMLIMVGPLRVFERPQQGKITPVKFLIYFQPFFGGCYFCNSISKRSGSNRPSFPASRSVTVPCPRPAGCHGRARISGPTTVWGWKWVGGWCKCVFFCEIKYIS